MTDAQFNMLIERMDRLVSLLEQLVILNTRPDTPTTERITRGYSLMQHAILRDSQPLQAIGKSIEAPKAAE